MAVSSTWSHSLSSSAEVKNEWSYISTICLHGMERDNYLSPVRRQACYKAIGM
jgi:hypothetical protein